MTADRPQVHVIRFKNAWVTKESFIAACYTRLCIRAEFKAERNSGLEPNPSPLQNKIIEDYTANINSVYTLGWYGGNARTYKMNLLPGTTGLRTGLRTQTFDKEKVLTNVTYHEEDVDREAILEIDTIEKYRAIMNCFVEFDGLAEITQEEKAVLRLSYLRSKYGMYTDTDRALEVLREKLAPDSVTQNNVQHKGIREDCLDGILSFITRMCNEDRTVCFGVPGITKSSVLFDSIIDNQEDEAAAKLVDNFQFSSEGVLVKPLWYRRTAAVLYIVTVLVGCGIIFGMNLTNKDNFLERIMDALSVLTLLLVSIFGLVKLTSEDPSILRNTVLGRKLITNPSRLVRYYSGGNAITHTRDRKHRVPHAY